ncbi:MAG: queuosine precursor transporter [Anaerolinea sp.]|nr:queuosine precursor transporter [Anaerolinea sp.]
MERRYKYIDLITVLFVTVLLMSNLLSSAKIIDVGINIGGLQFAFDAGTLVFPISYIFGDILTEIYGYRRSRRVIWSGFFATALMAFFIWLAGVLPGEALWQESVGQGAYDLILGSIWKLAIASLIAYFFGEFVNSYVLARMKILTQGRRVWTRTIGSTIAGQAVDTLAFFTIATALGAFPVELMAALMVTNYVLKVGIEVVLTPVTLQVIRLLKNAEQEDVFDYNTDFNPFRFDA